MNAVQKQLLICKTYIKWTTARVVGNSWCSPIDDSDNTNEPIRVCDSENEEEKYTVIDSLHSWGEIESVSIGNDRICIVCGD